MNGSILHLDVSQIGALLDLDPRDARVLLSVLALAPEGSYEGGERRLANRAGIAALADLRNSLERLARTPGPGGTPWLRREPSKGDGLVLVVQAGSLLVRHPGAMQLPRPKSAPAERSAPAKNLASVIAARRETLAGRGLDETADAWLAHLASLEKDGKLPVRVELLQLETLAEIEVRYGADAVREAVAAGLANLARQNGRADHYLRAVARRAAAGPSSTARRSSRGAKSDEVKF